MILSCRSLVYFCRVSSTTFHYYGGGGLFGAISRIDLANREYLCRERCFTGAWASIAFFFTFSENLVRRCDAEEIRCRAFSCKCV